MATKQINVERFSVISSKSFPDVLAAIESQIGHPDIRKFVRDIATTKTDEELQAAVRDAIGPTDLMEFIRFDHDDVN